MRLRLVSVALALLQALVFSGCATPRSDTSYVTLLPSPDGSVGQVLVQGARGEQLIARARDAAPLDGSAPPTPVDAARFQRDFAEALAAQPVLPAVFVLYFESGSTQFTAESQEVLPQIVRNAALRASADMSIVGHSDTLGSAELNEALSLKRAQAVADWLVSQGAKVDTLTVRALGKRQLQVATPDARDEARNRRVEVTVR
jgi:adhesin transport system outer membrane protein